MLSRLRKIVSTDNQGAVRKVGTLRDRTDEAGHTLGHYQLLEQIAAGGMGTVYKAYDKHLDRPVALKTLPSTLLDSATARRQFRNEALILARLNHPNIVTVHDFDTQEGIDFMIMEYVPGQTLASRLKQSTIAIEEVFQIVGQIADALEAAHEQGVIHRDLNSRNVLLTPEGNVKVADFGLATLLLPITSESTQNLKSASPAGTLPYMSPEQLRGADVDGRTDIWAVGCLLYEMAIGRPPFLEKTLPATIDAIFHHCPILQFRGKSSIAVGLEPIVSRCLNKIPSERYQSVKDLAQALHRIRCQNSCPVGFRASLEMPVPCRVRVIAEPRFLLLNSRRGRQAGPAAATAVKTSRPCLDKRKNVGHRTFPMPVARGEREERVTVLVAGIPRSVGGGNRLS
jgi:serine/threonine protein kinase